MVDVSKSGTTDSAPAIDARVGGSTSDDVLLTVENLTVSFGTERGRVSAVRGVSYEVARSCSLFA